MEQNTINRIFPTVQFYDYTAIRGRDSLENYHLTFSMKEDNLMDALAEMKRGRNIAVVFPVNEIHSTHLGLQIDRASCRERVCQYVSIMVVPISFNKQYTQ